MKNIQQNKILIVGNMGYVGTVLVRHLRSSYSQDYLIGYDIGYFSNHSFDTAFLPELFLNAQYFGDVRKFPSELLSDVSAIVYLAAISNDPMGNKYEEATFDINHRSCIALAEKAKKAGVKSFIFASSCSVYGAASDTPRTEDSSLDPITAYAKSKVYSEKDLKKLADKDFLVTCLRFSTACGMSPRLRLDLVLNDFVASAIINKKISILSDGRPWRPLIHVDDMARAIEWAIRRDFSRGKEYLVMNVGSNDWNYQIQDLAQATAKEIGGTEISINKNAMPDKRSYQVSFDFLKKLAPEAIPRATLSGTIKELKSSLEKIHFCDRDFRESKRFIRLKNLDFLRRENMLSKRLEWKSLDDSILINK